MRELAEKTVKIISDYRSGDSLKIDVDHVLKWVNQFEQKDRAFLLTELNHILQQAYFSKKKMLNCLFENVSFLSKKLKYKSEVSFLADTIYISMQGKEKSQTEILKLFYDQLPDKYGIQEKHLGSNIVKNVIYFDDVLATGKTLFRDIEKWLNNTSKKGESYFDLLKDGKYNLIVYTICCHEWGKSNVDFQLKRVFSEAVRKKVIYCDSFCIENHPTVFNPKLNFVYPVNHDIEMVNNYFQKIDTGDYTKYEKFAFRKNNAPRIETFFTSPENRIRYEHILLLKGVEILEKVSQLSVKSLRPLGYTVKSHKTFGLGTQFFTWRNVSNTTPLVFWWEANYWHPLFPVKNRGLN